ncbi:LexA family transcriptional regulator [Paraburkholderia sp. RL17-368-BIF-A]|uniref:LexA family protein n=1 Tax=Paraburkholderia sp. RL17-368-BIF-A TaxID=3031628 RepID=UPI0038C3CDFE
MNAKSATGDQMSDAGRLQALFHAWQRRQAEQGLPSSQAEAASALGMGQSAVSQYLKGTIPLNFRAASNFARLLGCTIRDISPRIAEQATLLTARVADSRENYSVWRTDRREPVYGPPVPPSGEPPDDSNRHPVLQPSQIDQWLMSRVDIRVTESYRSPIDVSPRSFFMRVPGESMFDANSRLSFREDELVLIDVDVRPKHGSVLLIRTASGDFILRQLISEGGKSFLKALNPVWPERITPIDTTALPFGTVVAKLSIL